jgi:hypothetical protein
MTFFSISNSNVQRDLSVVVGQGQNDRMMTIQDVPEIYLISPPSTTRIGCPAQSQEQALEFIEASNASHTNVNCLFHVHQVTAKRISQ